MYKRVAGVEDEKALADVTAELSDRYGAPPAAVENLLRYAALRLQSKRIGVAGIDRKRDLVNIRFVADAKIDPQRLADFVAKERGAQFSPAGILKFTLKATQAEEVLEKLQSLLGNLAAEKITVS
jgi:transcription-repair coupling factor (superfamily II helicase)